jgi:hypothetical protein
VNSSELAPSAAVNESTTVASRITGATIARSNSARITTTTSSTSGMITLRSWFTARSMSTNVAVVPPTSASASGTACTDARTRSTVAAAAGESAASVGVPSK